MSCHVVVVSGKTVVVWCRLGYRTVSLGGVPCRVALQNRGYIFKFSVTGDEGEHLKRSREAI